MSMAQSTILITLASELRMKVEMVTISTLALVPQLGRKYIDIEIVKGAVVMSDYNFVFISSNNSNYLLKGQHVFQNPKNNGSYRFNISDCND